MIETVAADRRFGFESLLHWICFGFRISTFGFIFLLGCSEPPPPQPPTDIGQKVSDNFLSLLAQSKYDEAWESTSAEFKSDEGRESFRDFVRARPPLMQPLKFVGAEPVVVNELPRTEFRYRPGDDKSPQTVKIILAKEGDDWKVERVLVE